MKAIVTIKIAKQSDHNPAKKIAGRCPVFPDQQCTDVTGEHHSTVVDFKDGFMAVERLMKEMVEKYGHVTRIEILDAFRN